MMKNKKLLIFGIGFQGAKYIEYFSQLGYNIDGVSLSGTNKKNLPLKSIFAFHEILKRQNSFLNIYDIIVVSVEPITQQQKVISMILKQDFENTIIIEKPITYDLETFRILNSMDNVIYFLDEIVFAHRATDFYIESLDVFYDGTIHGVLDHCFGILMLREDLQSILINTSFHDNTNNGDTQDLNYSLKFGKESFLCQSGKYYINDNYLGRSTFKISLDFLLEHTFDHLAVRRLFKKNFYIYTQYMKEKKFHVDVNKPLGDGHFGSEKYINKSIRSFEYLPLRNMSEIQYEYGQNIKEFIKNIHKLRKGDRDIIYNIPKCLYFDQIPKYKVYKDPYKNLYVKTNVCKNCIYTSNCKGLHYLFLKTYGKEIISPITHLTEKQEIVESFLRYSPFAINFDSGGTPININHYKPVYSFISSSKKNSKIMEIGCFIGLFIDFLTQNGFKSCIGLERDKEFVSIGKKFTDLRLYHHDVYKEPFSLKYGKQDIIIMLGVFHNDYDSVEYNIKIIDYCIQILKNCYDALEQKGILIFTTHVFTLPVQDIKNIGFSIIDHYEEQGSKKVYYYIVIKGK